jgi:predicted CXXCH cytochrome family protein
MKITVFVVAVLIWSTSALAEENYFSTYLYPKFQTKGCTNCHDYFTKERGGLVFQSHKGRSPDMCIYCHTDGVTGFKHADDWFAQPGLYTSGMNPQQTCETIKTVMNAKFKNKVMVARQMELHLFDDPRVLWGIEGATAKSGYLPGDGKETDLVKEGLTKWKEQVKAWINSGMKCQ